jgi:hypothetical protein
VLTTPGLTATLTLGYFRFARHSGTTRVWATLGFKGKVFRTPLAPIHSYEFQV